MSNSMLVERILIEFLNGVVGKCDKLTKQLVATHDSFDRRMQALQDVAIPISNSTNRLQTIVQNTERTVVLIDNVLQFYTVYDELNTYISNGPTGDMTQYLRHLEQLQGSIDYFKRIAVKQKTTGNEFSKVNNLLKCGQRKLMSECEVMIGKYSNTYQPSDLDILLFGDDDAFYQPRYTMNKNDIETLSMVFKWFAQQHFKYGPINLYASTRGEMIKKSLELYRKRQEDEDASLILSVNSSSYGSASPMIITPTSKLQSKLEPYGSGMSSIRQKQDKLRSVISSKRAKYSSRQAYILDSTGDHSPSSQSLMDSADASKLSSSSQFHNHSHRTPQPPYQLQSPAFSRPEQREATSQSKTFATLFVVAFMLFEREKRHIDDIFPEDLTDEVFGGVAHSTLSYLNDLGQDLCNEEGNVNAITWAISLLHILNEMFKLRPAFVRLFGKTFDSRQSQVSQLSMIFESTAIRALNAVAEDIKTDPKEEHLVPYGGGVQKINFTALSYLETICDKYFEVASLVADGMYLNGEKTNVNSSLLFQNVIETKEITETPLDADDSFELIPNERNLNLSRYFVTLLKWLNMNILAKSDCYQTADKTIRSIYLLNNIQYILQTIQGRRLMDTLRLTRSDIEDQYKHDILTYKKEYSNCYTRLIQTLQNMLEWQNNHNIPDAKLRDRDRDFIKDGFNAVNREIDYLIEQHDTFIIHEIDLRKELKKEAKDLVIPLYTRFYQMFTRKDFTKNKGKYMKYSVELLLHRIDNFFERCS